MSALTADEVTEGYKALIARLTERSFVDANIDAARIELEKSYEIIRRIPPLDLVVLFTDPEPLPEPVTDETASEEQRRLASVPMPVPPPVPLPVDAPEPERLAGEPDPIAHNVTPAEAEPVIAEGDLEEADEEPEPTN